MILITDNIEDIKGKPLVATIGFFDGVHYGHRSLIRELINEASLRKLPSAVITFAVHPRKILHPEYKPELLSSFDEKVALLSETGVDYCIVLNFTIELSLLTAKEFIENILKQRFDVRTLIIGYDHRFGHDRTDGFEQYVLYGKGCGMEVLQASRYDKSDMVVSSSSVRKLLKEGNVELASVMLTYNYSMTGYVTSGHRIGRSIGFPTANIQIYEEDKLLPATGVYAVKVFVKGNVYKGMLHIGNRPTLNNGDNITIEVNIIDFSGDIYGEDITISFISRIRDNLRFDSLSELKEQLVKDRELVRSIVEKSN